MRNTMAGAQRVPSQPRVALNPAALPLPAWAHFRPASPNSGFGTTGSALCEPRERSPAFQCVPPARPSPEMRGPQREKTVAGTRRRAKGRRRGQRGNAALHWRGASPHTDQHSAQCRDRKRKQTKRRGDPAAESLPHCVALPAEQTGAHLVAGRLRAAPGTGQGQQTRAGTQNQQEPRKNGEPWLFPRRRATCRARDRRPRRTRLATRKPRARNAFYDSAAGAVVGSP